MMVLLAIYHMGNLPSIPDEYAERSINSSSSYFRVLCFTEQGIVSPLKEVMLSLYFPNITNIRPGLRNEFGLMCLDELDSNT